MSRLLIDVESRTGTKTGVIATAFDLQYDEPLSLCGAFSFLMPGTDERRTLLAQKTSQVRMFIDGAEVFLGIVESLRDSIGQDGAPTLEVAGRSKLVELAEATVSATFDQSDVPFSAMLQQSAGPWTMDTTNGTSTLVNAIYAAFFRETILLAVARLSVLTGGQFAYKPTLSGSDRKLIWMNTTGTASGIRAVAAVGDAIAAEGNPFICYIQTLERVEASPHLYTLVAPYGSGEGEARLTLKASTVTPAGYTINKANNSIAHDANLATYGTYSRALQFKEITPISNTTADLTAAANMLANATVRWLERYSKPHAHYRLSVTGLPHTLLPGQTIRAVYANDQYDIDGDMKVLEIRTSLGADGVVRKSLLVADTDIMPEDSSSYQVGDLEQGNIYMSHPQMNANSDTTSYRVPVDEFETGEVNFSFGNEVVQLQQVVFRFKINSLVSTIRAAGGDSLTTGPSSATTTVSGGSSAPTSGPSTASTTASGDASHQHTTALQDGTTGSAVSYSGSLLYVSGGGTIATQAGTVPHSHNMEHAHTVTILAHDHGMEHDHGVTAAVTVTYGVFKDTANKFTLAQLQWQVNGSGGFTPFETNITGVTNPGGDYIEVTTDIAHNMANGDTVHIATTTDYNGSYEVSSVASTTFRVFKAYVSSQTGKARTVADKSSGGQWWELDITSRVQDSTNFRPNQENNLLEIKRLTGTLKTASVDGFLNVRNIIQSIAYT